MTKKQFGIIFTLMALIVCVGVLSVKLNGEGYNDPTDLASILTQENTDESSNADQTVSTSEYFYSMRLTKEQQDQKYIDDMKAISEDPNASQEQKDIANNALIEKTKHQEQEGRVEVHITSKGYKDAICMIDPSQVKVYVKVDDKLSEENSASIKKVVEDITGLTDVNITAMK